MMKKIKKYTACFLVMLMSLTLITPLFTLKAQDHTIYISTAKELMDLSKKCTLDSWSKDKKVVLTNDIDLSHTDFTPIPIFSGMFDGAGYTLGGLNMRGNGSNQGLFRYVQEGAIIQNLNVEGSIVPGGSKSYIGSIAGSNRGTLKNCTFSGTVEGKQYIGGIAGVNESTGMIIECATTGMIYGEYYVGGITGENMGTILRSTNEASVNTKAVDKAINVEEMRSIEENLDVDEIISEGSKFPQNTSDITDIGGIAGVNIGIIQNATNKGTIGYEHVGYNVGGIAGRQSGYITGCNNEGAVYGRKEVGGIVGQMEPYTMLTYSQSKLDELGKELDVLQGLISNAMTNGHSTSNSISNQLTSIQNYVDTARHETQSLLDQTGEIINQNIEVVNEVSVTVAEALDRFVPVSGHLTDLFVYIEEAMTPIRKSLDELVKVNESIGNGMKEVEQTTKYIYTALGNLDDALYYFNKSRNLVEESMTNLVNGQLKSAIESMKKASSTLDQSIYALQDSLRNLQDIKSDLEDVFDEGDNANHYMDQSIRSMSEAMEIIEDAAGSLTSAAEEFSSLVEYLAEQPEVKFVTSDSDYQETKNNLSEALGETSNAVAELNAVINEQSHRLLDDMGAISDQLFVVFDILLDITESVATFDIKAEEYKEDISDNDTEEQTQGKVANSVNTGSVVGDINVGGIAGAISVERRFDPEDDIEIIGDKSINFIFQTRAVIRACQSNGEVRAKKDGAGGIVGSMKLGYIVDSIAEGKITSSAGNYVGGIAGKSDSLIRGSYAKCILEGGNYIGGIAGQGMDIVNCRSYTKIDGADEYSGAIAGNVLKNGQLKGNFFVENALGAIDGISYTGKAEPMKYEEFIQLEGMPSIFSNFMLNFWIGDVMVTSMPFKYEESLQESELPQIPSKEGYYGKWEEINYTSITFDQDINVIYIPLVATLESDERKNNAMPILLVEGQFTQEDELAAVRTEHTAPEMNDQEEQLEQWAIIIPEDGKKIHTVRYLIPEQAKNIKIYGLQDEEWVQIETKKDGKYMVFEVEGNDIVFSVINTTINFQKEIISLMIVSILLLGGVIGLKKKYTKSNMTHAV